MSTIATKLLSADEFAALPNPSDGSRQELVRGEVIIMPPPSHKHGRIQLKIAYVFWFFLNRNPIGQATVNSGVITEMDPDTVRVPDVSYWSIERMPLDADPDVYASPPAPALPVQFPPAPLDADPTVAPDLAVEVLTPGNRRQRMRQKIREYFKSGVRMVWVVDPEERTVTVYRQPDVGTRYWEDATISGEDVIPGFSCPIADFFPPMPQGSA